MVDLYDGQCNMLQSSIWNLVNDGIDVFLAFYIGRWKGLKFTCTGHCLGYCLLKVLQIKSLFENHKGGIEVLYPFLCVTRKGSELIVKVILQLVVGPSLLLEKGPGHLESSSGVQFFNPWSKFSPWKTNFSV